MGDRSAGHVPDDPREWQPMRPYRGRRVFDIRDPILEPLWSGVRVIVHVGWAGGSGSLARVALIDLFGADLADELPVLCEAIDRGVMADEAVIDGVITRQVSLDGLGAAPIPEMRGRPSLVMRGSAELDVVPRGSVGKPGESEAGLVALDLLRVDGSSLLDVPLLERKRLLESVLRPGELLRTSVYVRPPIETWIATWKAIGLRGGILKAANSRYLPGDDTIEWRLVEHVGRRGG